MRYSLLAVAVASVLTLSACNKSETDTAANDNSTAAAPADTNTTAGSANTSSAAEFKSAEGIEMNITGAGASFPQLKFFYI